MQVKVLACAALFLVNACSTQAPTTTRSTSAPTATVPSDTATQATPAVPVDVTASYARTQPGTTAAGAGSISGLVNCACGGLPAQDVYAISTDGTRFYATQTVPGQTRWQILGVATGQYYVYAAGRVAKAEGGTYDSAPRRFAAGYTVAVACGLSVSCTDHSPLVVTVRPGAETGGVETFDWYSTNFPLVPTAGPAAPFLKAPPASFATAADAAAYLGVESTDAPQVAAQADCPINLACFWLVSSRAGTGAAYYIATAGANGQYLSCGLYLIGGGSSWQTLDRSCRPSTAFPAVGSSGAVRLGMGETGCVNVHDSPSLSGRVVACVPDGTAVRIDDGPTYAANGSTDQSTEYWWHIAGKGWMVHTYLRNG
jgi:hypothetical protein